MPAEALSASATVIFIFTNIGQDMSATTSRVAALAQAPIGHDVHGRSSIMASTSGGRDWPQRRSITEFITGGRDRPRCPWYEIDHSSELERIHVVRGY
jgi:hypothetical protein